MTRFEQLITRAAVIETGDAPPELHLQIDMGAFPSRPDHIAASSGGTEWTVREYGHVLIDFFKQWDMQAEFDDSDPIALAEFNVSGATEYAYIPVRITDWRGLRSQIFYAPVPWVSRFLSAKPNLASWTVQPDYAAAERGKLLWRYVPMDDRGHAYVVTVDAEPDDGPDGSDRPAIALPGPTRSDTS